MVWIGLHGVMFLFLFSDFYKAKYTQVVGKHKKLLSSIKTASTSNNTSSKHNYTNGKISNGNQGACMVSSCYVFLIM